MFFLLFILAGLIFAIFTGGNLKNIEKCHIKYLWMPIVAIVIKSCSSFIILIPIFVFVIFQYFILLLFVLINIKSGWSIWIIGIGTFLNFIVIAFNDFCMPISSNVLSKIDSGLLDRLVAGEIRGYFPANSKTILYFLSDIIYIPVPYIKGFASIGDLFIGVGVFLLIQYLLKRKGYR